MSVEYEESTVFQSKVMRIAHLKAFRTLMIGFTGMGTQIIQTTVKTIAWQVESDIEQDNSIEDPESPEPRDVSPAPNVPGLIRYKWKTKRQAENVLMTVNAIETKTNKGVKKKLDTMRQCFTSFFMYLDREL